MMVKIGWIMIVFGALGVIMGLKSKNKDPNTIQGDSNLQMAATGIMFIVLGILIVTPIGYEIFYWLMP